MFEPDNRITPQFIQEKMENELLRQLKKDLDREEKKKGRPQYILVVRPFRIDGRN